MIVGFPGETREDFEQTLSLIQEVGFTSLFTFIFSPREGTPAAKMDDPIPAEEKSAWFREMTAAQEEIAAVQSAAMVGQTRRALLESAEDGRLEARLPENIVIRVEGDPALVGRRADVEITGARSWVLYGRITNVL